MSKLKPSVSSKPSSRKTQFQPAHAIQYGLAVAMRDTHGLVCSVRCQFCQFFGREEAVKRKRTQNTKFYKAPYRPQYYVDHNNSAHAEKWAAYKAWSPISRFSNSFRDFHRVDICFSGIERIIAFGGRKMTSAELMYLTREKELLAALHAMRTWLVYLLDKPFYINTDH
ncbi:hypothetical protein PHMEG_00022729 [Phytophthora megakarya]|uniref:Reverse transcriptase RNase H-like domain-containing protein n=1 Tax=Phytophthora megakarya TaxID=4795 RepID=A0A225VJN8_9STRA|nr:hypothetical protein PHMEG_00022729 [Phytophthora megakarya]